MAYPLYVQPDPVLALIQYLRGTAELVAVTPASKIVSELPSSPDFSTPYVIVQRAGGTGIWPAIDEPAMQVDTVGGTKIVCGLASRVARAAVWAISNDIMPAAVLVSGVDEMTPSWMPDQVSVPPLPRYTARYRVLMHP